MTKFKIISFSKEIPTKFKWINLLILIPILLWPLVFLMTIFFFDDPNANPIMVWGLFFAVNLYPLYLFVLFELNARLYKKLKIVGYIIPSLIFGSLLYIFGSFYISNKQSSKEQEIANQERKEAGYIGNCDTYRILNNSVYYKDSVLNADALSFEYLGCHYGKDKNIAFKGKDPIQGSHSESFEIIDWQWQKDNFTYYYKGEAMNGIDYPTFEILDLSYSKDKNKVYFRMKTVKEAQPETFKINRMTGIGDDGINKYEHGKKI